MSPAHDQQRREQILATHVRCRRHCAACGQSWPCTDRASVDPPRRPSWQQIAVAALLAAALTGVLVALVVGIADLLIAGAKP